MRHAITLLLFLWSAFTVAVNAEHAPADSVVQSWLETTYNVRFSTNNSVVLLPTGQDKFDDMFLAIRAAKHSIHMEYFNFRNDSISHLLFDLLKEKTAEGVEVRLMFDGFGNMSNNRPLHKVHLDSLRACGIEIVEYDPIRPPYLTQVFHRDHRKIVVIDGVIAYTGGMNVADYYIKGTPQVGDWRDMHVRLEGDAVGVLQGIFLKIWNRTTHQDIHGPQYYPGERNARVLFPMLRQDTVFRDTTKVVGVVNREPHETGRIISQTFTHCIDAAQTSITIINPYLTLNLPIRRALNRAIKRGIRVQIMVSANSDIPLTPRIVEHTVHRLMKKGAEVYFYQGGFHHTKVMIVDGVTTFLGSANLNSRSLGWDYECNLLINGRNTATELQQIFDRDKDERCYRLTPERWQQFSPWHRFKCWLLQIFTPFV